MQVAVRTTDALNMRRLPRRMSSADISDFDVEGPDSERRWTVSGEAIERFAAMTNWDYYEAMLRFQKVLDATGQSLQPPHGPQSLSAFVFLCTVACLCDGSSNNAPFLMCYG